MRWTRKVSSTLVALGALATLGGCPDLPDGPRFLGKGSTAPRRGGTLMLYEQSRVRMLDPHVAFDAASGMIIEMLFDSLYEYDAETKLVPIIAAALPESSADGRTFRIPIRKGVRFHNGRELNAHDVVWSFERMLHPDLSSPGSPFYRAIEGYDEYQEKKANRLRGIRALDAHTVQFQLSKADQSFVHTLAMRFSAPIPREAVGRRDREFKRYPVGTGPFKLTSWDRGVRLVLERNRQYHVAQRPYLDRVVVEEGLKRETAFLRFRNGEMDIMPTLSPADRLELKGAGWRPYVARTARSDVYGLAMNAGLAPFDNVHVRRAVAFALDRQRWARARNNDVRPTGQILPPSIPGYDANLPNAQRFDLQKAREEMRLAGHPRGLEEPVTMWMSDSPAGRIYGELAQADLAKIGIELRLKPVSFPVYLEETGKPKTAQMSSVGWLMDFPDASNFLSLVSSSMISDRDSSNRAFYSNRHLDELLDRAIIERDREKRTAMYREANDFVSKEAPWAFFCNSQGMQAWQPYVKGYTPHPVYEVRVDDVWLDLPRRRNEGDAPAPLSVLEPWRAF